eukprot:COSAG03_NODE_5440_length_1249_cov_0.941739_2_plen_111_part_01
MSHQRGVISLRIYCQYGKREGPCTGNCMQALDKQRNSFLNPSQRISSFSLYTSGTTVTTATCRCVYAAVPVVYLHAAEQPVVSRGAANRNTKAPLDSYPTVLLDRPDRKVT